MSKRQYCVIIVLASTKFFSKLPLTLALWYYAKSTILARTTDINKPICWTLMRAYTFWSFMLIQIVTVKQKQHNQVDVQNEGVKSIPSQDLHKSI